MGLWVGEQDLVNAHVKEAMAPVRPWLGKFPESFPLGCNS